LCLPQNHLQPEAAGAYRLQIKMFGPRFAGSNGVCPKFLLTRLVLRGEPPRPRDRCPNGTGAKLGDVWRLVMRHALIMVAVVVASCWLAFLVNDSAACDRRSDEQRHQQYQAFYEA
jgi:hypothetical protein